MLKSNEMNVEFFTISTPPCTRPLTASCAAEDPDWLLLFRLHYAIIEMEQRHPWLKKEGQA